MEFEDEYGDSFFCLPDAAICYITQENPKDMYECPLQKYDLWGDVCCPPLCEYYGEEW